jgi:hypothetical protein
MILTELWSGPEVRPKHILASWLSRLWSGARIDRSRKAAPRPCPANYYFFLNASPRNLPLPSPFHSEFEDALRASAHSSMPECRPSTSGSCFPPPAKQLSRNTRRKILGQCGARNCVLNRRGRLGKPNFRFSQAEFKCCLLRRPVPQSVYRKYA